jgi:hypothetical protein
MSAFWAASIAEVDALLRADPPKDHREGALGVTRLKRTDRHAVLDRGQEAVARRAGVVLGAADAVQPEVWARRLQRLGRIPRRRQMQGREHRDAGGRVGRKIDAVEMHEVDRRCRQRLGDRGAVARPGTLAGRVVERARLGRDRHQRPGDLGPLLRHHDRAVAGVDQRVIEVTQHLLGAADAVRPDPRQRVGDAEHGEAHRGAARPSSPSARAQRSSIAPGHAPWVALVEQVAPVRQRGEIIGGRGPETLPLGRKWARCLALRGVGLEHLPLERAVGFAESQRHPGAPPSATKRWRTQPAASAW